MLFCIILIEGIPLQPLLELDFVNRLGKIKKKKFPLGWGGPSSLLDTFCGIEDSDMHINSTGGISSCKI